MGGRRKEIALGGLLLVPVAIIAWFCAYMIQRDVILQYWLTNVLRFFIITAVALILYFVLVLIFTNLKAAFRMIFGHPVGKKK